MIDDLNAPLGQGKKAKRGAALAAFVPHALAGALALSLVSFTFWAATADDPLGGEPTALLAIDQGTAKVAEDASAPVKGEQPSRYDGPAPGSKTVTIIDGTSGKREEVTIPSTPGSPRASNASAAPAIEAAPAVNPHLIENSRHGSIPKIGPDGAKPSEVYARPVNLAPGKPDGPRIAIVISGLGIGTSGTAEALVQAAGLGYLCLCAL